MHVDGDDFTGGVYRVKFEIQVFGKSNALSSVAEIPIHNDFIPEPTEYFTCVIFRPTEEEGFVVDSLINIEIEDDDGEYCKTVTVVLVCTSFNTFNLVECLING